MAVELKHIIPIYDEHVKEGVPIRVIARRLNRHASTVLRWIRKVEQCRDDVEFDVALEKGEAQQLLQHREEMTRRKKEQMQTVAGQILQNRGGSPKMRYGLEDEHIRVLDQVSTHVQTLKYEDESVDRIVKRLGPTLSEVVIRVCRTQDGMEEIEKKSGLPARSGKIVLRCALEVLKRTGWYDF